jgi:FKBP-type peptidyl-prolyl cis-trans isomerase FklB
MKLNFTRTLPLTLSLVGYALSAHAVPPTKGAVNPALKAAAAKAAPVDQTSPDYSMGLTVGESINKAGATNINIDAFEKGLHDGISGKASTQDDRDRISKYMSELRGAASAPNKAAAKAFLAKNAKADGVVQTASGLQYKVVDAGKTDAASPQLSDTVTVHYRGHLIDGTVFDSSYERGQPVSFPVNGVIKGWQEALQLMKPGAKYQLFIAPELAYGDAGPGKILPGSLLIFDVELLSVGDAK